MNVGEQRDIYTANIVDTVVFRSLGKPPTHILTRSETLSRQLKQRFGYQNSSTRSLQIRDRTEQYLTHI